MFFFRSTASARCFPTWRAAFPRMEPAQGLTMVMSSRSALFLSRGWLSKSAPAYVDMSIRNGFSLSFCPLALPRTGQYLCLCVYVLSSHLFCRTPSGLLVDVPTGVTQKEGHRISHPPSSCRAFALVFLARKIQPLLSLVDCEVELLCTNELNLSPLDLMGIFFFFFCEEKSQFE